MKRSVIKIVLANSILIIIGLISIEIFARIYTRAKINPASPLRSLRSIGDALLNKSFDPGLSAQLHADSIYRKPYPYLMFKGAPNLGRHNSLGYLIADPITAKTINIALFGGSTGYYGTPPIINLLTDELNHGRKMPYYSALNFSVVSSNHNQHLHSLVENYSRYPVDLVIFYGGYNETLSSAFYDPRPGYPYNFDVKYETSPEDAILRKHSALYSLFARTNIRSADYVPFSPKWNNGIVDNYINVISSARLLSKVLTTGRCKIPFIFIYQPYQMSRSVGVPDSFKANVHSRIKKFVSVSADGIDASTSLPGSVNYYTDIVHLNQSGNEIVSRFVLGSSVFRKAVDSCRL